jgi:tyrosinase
MSNGARVRRDIWKLEDEQAWHPITRAYALGVRELKRRDRDPDDQTSWAWQTQIHGLPDFEEDPPYRGQCQHFCFVFLPWHRCYLHWFERILRSAIQDIDEIDAETKAAWSLPYWNYSDGPGRLRLPDPFIQETLDGEENPLYIRVRRPSINRGEPMDPLTARLVEALAPLRYVDDPLAAGFGGAPVSNHWRDNPNGSPGPVEGTPHGAVHNAVAGVMGDPAYAAQDPVFWMHHANIDRLWEVWRKQGGENPDAGSAWGTTEFHFHDENRNPVTCTAASVVDMPGELGYTYEDTDVPESTRRARRRRVKPDIPDNPPELVGATEEPVELGKGRADVEIDVGRPTGPAARRGGDPERVYLAVEGIEAVGRPDVTYAVYLNLPDDEDPDDAPEAFYVGNVDLFGIEAVGRVDTDHAAHGLRRTFDITDLVDELREEGGWDPRAMTVTFSPLKHGYDREEPDLLGPVKVGRIGLYYR